MKVLPLIVNHCCFPVIRLGILQFIVGFNVLLGFAVSVNAQETAPEVQTVAFSRADRSDAVASIPFQKLNQQTQQSINYVVQNPSIFRRLPVQVIDCDPSLYRLMVRYPEIVVNIWQLMGISSVKLKRTGQYSFHANDGAGTVTNVDLVYGNQNKHIFYASGYYEGPLAPGKVTAKCVLILESGYTTTASKKTMISNRLDVFVRFDNRGADLLARTLHPLIGKTADYNFSESSAFLGKISKSAEDNIAGLHSLSEKLTMIDPTLKQQFLTITTEVYKKNAEQEQQTQLKYTAASNQDVSYEPRKLEANTQAKSIKPQVISSTPISSKANIFVGSVPRKRTAKLRR